MGKSRPTIAKKPARLGDRGEAAAAPAEGRWTWKSNGPPRKDYTTKRIQGRPGRRRRSPSSLPGGGRPLSQRAVTFIADRVFFQSVPVARRRDGFFCGFWVTLGGCIPQNPLDWVVSQNWVVVGLRGREDEFGGFQASRVSLVEGDHSRGLGGRARRHRGARGQGPCREPRPCGGGLVPAGHDPGREGLSRASMAKASRKCWIRSPGQGLDHGFIEGGVPRRRSPGPLKSRANHHEGSHPRGTMAWPHADGCPGARQELHGRRGRA